ncbi:pseudaminic acid cytidylyltransferase [Pseudoalteromonas sp. YIC-656]|uniref:pseudaminic acid cytidylyltransferase n=1 Tax=Pseudoalteromonas pernae TaxID=3118054 RepID=UPI003241BA17
MKIAIIPARGGSKRIPHKNIKPFCGRPIIDYAIQTALDSNLFDEVIVSTDDPEIAKQALRSGAKVPFTRPLDLADDHTPTRSVIQHSLDYYENQGMNVDYICCIYATSPFLSAEILRAAYSALEDAADKHACFSATEFNYSPYRGFLYQGNGPELMFPEHQKSRSQDLKPVYHDAGQFYLYRTTHNKTINPVINSANAIIHTLPSYLVHDIDTPDDWTRAELFYEAMKSHENSRN